MKAVENIVVPPHTDRYGLEELNKLHPDFIELCGKVAEAIKPYVTEEADLITCYFTDKNDDEIGSEYDTCSDDDCIAKAKKKIKKNLGRATKIIERHLITCVGEHDAINICSVCSKPLNDWLVDVESEFEGIELQNLTDETALRMTVCTQSFIIWVVYRSIENETVNSYSLSRYQTQTADSFEQDTNRREAFYQRVQAFGLALLEYLKTISPTLKTVEP